MPVTNCAYYYSTCLIFICRYLRAKHLKLSSLKSLIHLRYLELHGLDIETLPDSIYSLRKLEILKLKHFPELRCLPEHLTCLGNLRHLVTEDCDSLSRMFPFVGKLSCLRTLSVYIVKLERGHSLAELKDLNLGGKLSIDGLENVDNLYEAQEANLLGKSCIFELCLSWSKKGETEARATSYEQVLEGLQPHSNLKRLKICDYEGLCFPSWLGILNSLVTLELQYCKNCVSLSPIGKLPYLKKFQLLHLDNVQYLDDECDTGLLLYASTTIILPFVCCSFPFATFPPNLMRSLCSPPPLLWLCLLLCSNNLLYCISMILHSCLIIMILQWLLVSLMSFNDMFRLFCFIYFTFLLLTTYQFST